MVVTNNVETNSYKILESFKANESKKTNVTQQPTPQVLPDTVEVNNSKEPVQTPEPQKNSSFIQKFKNGIAAIKKLFIGVGEYTKGTVKGLFYGGIAAGGVLGIDAIRGASKIINSVKAENLAKPIEENAPKVAKKAVKVLSTKGKVVAGLVGAAIFGYQLFKASLNSTERKANVDHRWGSGHNQQ